MSEVYWVDELAQILGRSGNTVRKWVRAGWLKPVGFKRLRFRTVPAYRLDDARAIHERAPRTDGHDSPGRDEPVGPPDAPTYATPGSEERIRVYERRLRMKRHLHHPGDARIEIPTWLKVR